MTEHRQTLDLDQLAHSRNGHSVYGPSSSHMWLHCSHSLIANLLAHDPGNIDAAYGTVAHGVTETWLKSGKRPSHLVGTSEFVEVQGQWWGYYVDIDESMLDHAEVCIDAVSMIEGEKFFEMRVDFSVLTPIPHQGGTADCIILEHLGGGKYRLWVIDWKFGVGVQVFAERNPQGMMYALGAMYRFGFDYDITEVRIGIEQPRLGHSDRWDVSVPELMTFAEYVRERAKAAWAINAPRTAGEKSCTFCKVKDDCATLAMYLVEKTASGFDDAPIFNDEHEFVTSCEVGLLPAPAPIASLTVDAMVGLLAHRSAVDKFFNAINDRLHAMAESGQNVNGMKIVEGRSSRYFRNERDAKSRLLAKGVPLAKVVKQKLCSPAEAETLLREVGIARKDIPNLLEDLVAKAPGKPTLVPDSDKRPALTHSTDGVFEALD